MAAAARKLLATGLDTFDKDSIAALYADSVRGDVDFDALMVDLKTSYLIARDLRALLKTLWDPDIHTMS